MFSIHFDIGNIVLKDSWDIDLSFEMHVSQATQVRPLCYRVPWETSIELGVLDDRRRGRSFVPQGTCPWRRRCSR